MRAAKNPVSADKESVMTKQFQNFANFLSKLTNFRFVMLDNCSILLYYLIVRVVLSDSVCCDAWLSLVERYVRDVEVAGSNPVIPIEYYFVKKFVLG